MEVHKFYDTFCDVCGNWYGATFAQSDASNKKDAIREMKQNGWGTEDGKTVCHNCRTKRNK